MDHQLAREAAESESEYSINEGKLYYNNMINDNLNIALITKMSIRGIRILPLLRPGPHPSEMDPQSSADPSISCHGSSINGW